MALAGQVGQALGRPVQFVEVPADSVVAAVVAGRADLAIAPMTPVDEARADFSVPFYTARLGVARTDGAGRIAEVASRFFSATFFKIALGLAVLLFLVGLSMWGLERHQEGDDFRENKAGIWDGFWWSGVTMTTIGYGDTVPSSVGGRALALLWMLVSMALTASLTASLVSALGLGSGGNAVLDDLRGDRVGVVEGSTAAQILAETGVDAVAFPSIEAGVRAVEADSLDAFVGSAPRVRDAADGVTVTTTGVEFERWALAVAPASALHEPVTRAVLDRLQSPGWPDTVHRYTGD